MVGWVRLRCRVGGAAALVVLGVGPALALDTAALPQSCAATLAAMQGDKARFGQLGRLMSGYRKANDTANFCNAARSVLTIIKDQNARLETCVGELAAAPVVQGTTDRMLALRAVYKRMLDAAKDPKNDQLHCGLADQ